MSNLIQVGNTEYCIGSDVNQWIVYKRVPVTKYNINGLSAIGYYTELIPAVTALSKRMLRLEEANSVRELYDAASKINKMMNETFNLEAMNNG